MRRCLAALTVVPLLLVGLAGCGESGSGGGESGTIDDVRVDGQFGEAPKVVLDAPFRVEETHHEVVSLGNGNEVVEGSLASLHVQIVNGRTGEKSLSTYDQGSPITTEMAEGRFFSSVLDAVLGKPEGTRIAVASAPEDAFGTQGAEQLGIRPTDSVVFVVDIVAVPLAGPVGEAVEPPADAPTVVTDPEGDIERLEFDGAAAPPPDELQVITLIDGAGDPIRPRDTVLFDYIGQVYGSDEPFDNSYESTPVRFTIGAGALIEAWDVGLEGVREGSRVMLIVPPALGYGQEGNPQIGVSGTDTLVFVIDVLAVGLGQP